MNRRSQSFIHHGNTRAGWRRARDFERTLCLNPTSGEPYLTIARSHFEHPRATRMLPGDVVVATVISEETRSSPRRARVMRHADGYNEVWIDLGT